MDDGQTCIKSMHFWHNVLYCIFRCVYYTVYFLKYGRYDFEIVKKYEFSHGGYISVTRELIKKYNFMSNKPIKAYILMK